MRFYLPHIFRLRGGQVDQGVLQNLGNPEVPKKENVFTVLIKLS